MNKTISLTAGALALLLSACASDGFDAEPTQAQQAALGGAQLCGVQAMRTDNATAAWPARDIIVWPPHQSVVRTFRVPETAVQVAGDEMPGGAAELTLFESPEQTVRCTYSQDGGGLYALTGCRRDTWGLPRGGEITDERVFTVIEAEFAVGVDTLYLHRPVAAIELEVLSADGEGCTP
jgi:hypothetical protein